MLQVSVHYYHAVAGGEVHPGQHRSLFPEVARQVDISPTFVAGVQLFQHHKSAVGTAVIDGYYFPFIPGHGVHDGLQPRVKCWYGFLFVIAGYEYRYLTF